jgi:hypothetical protein
MKMQNGALRQEVGEASEENGSLTTGSGGEFQVTLDQTKLDKLNFIMFNLLCLHYDHKFYCPSAMNCGHGTYVTYS